MMMNLFSIFDPTSTFKMPLNWMSTILGLFFMPLSYWLIPNRLLKIWISIMKMLNKELKNLIKNKLFKSTLIFISLFLIIMFSNSLGLFPYIFTSSSHLAMTFSIAFPLWTSFMIFGWFNNFNHMLADLVPMGTPKMLMSFMVCIETVSNLIRPGTLAIRLSANMIAGHLLLCLLGNSGYSMTPMLINILIIAQMMLLILEIAVAVIQAYVFATLSTLYFKETS